jgi:hypothetical protein
MCMTKERIEKDKVVIQRCHISFHYDCWYAGPSHAFIYFGKESRL